MGVKAEVTVIQRLRAWRSLFGEPFANGRSNPDNDIWFMLLDAEDCIEGLRQYAKSLEQSLASRPPQAPGGRDG